MSQYIIEIATSDFETTRSAVEGGADRIELCAGPGEGGTTPSYAFIKSAREKLQIDLYVMIRPRGGDFLYSADDFQIMKNDIAVCKELGCDGIVTGILTKDGKVDKERCRQLVELAYPLEATFHRAFDRVTNFSEALEDVIESGFERILTSGLKPKAIDSTDILAQLIKQSNERIIIMPGSGVNAQNILKIAGSTGATEFHSSACFLKGSEMDFRNEAMNESLNHISVNAEEVKKMAQLLREYKK